MEKDERGIHELNGKSEASGPTALGSPSQPFDAARIPGQIRAGSHVCGNRGKNRLLGQNA